MLAHERLTAWRLCHELVLRLPNIAEGAAKRGPTEFRRFLDISIGSLAELAYTLRVAKDLGLLTSDDWTRLETLRNRAGYMTWRLYASIAKAAKRR